jgi:hypothetical protein
LIVLQFVWIFAKFLFLLQIFPYIPYSIVATCKLYWFDCRTSFPSFIFIFLRNSDAHIFWIIKKEIKAKNSCQSRSQHIRTKRWQKIKK